MGTKLTRVWFGCQPFHWGHTANKSHSHCRKCDPQMNFWSATLMLKIYVNHDNIEEYDGWDMQTRAGLQSYPSLKSELAPASRQMLTHSRNFSTAYLVRRAKGEVQWWWWWFIYNRSCIMYHVTKKWLPLHHIFLRLSTWPLFANTTISL